MKGRYYLEEERRQYQERGRKLPEQVVADEAIQKTCPDLMVKHGVFQRMKYPQAKSVCSALFPKLLGSHE